MRKSNIEIISWIGVALIVLAYFASTINLVNVNSLIYILANLFGSIAIVTSSISKRDFQPATLNIIWAVIALIGLAGVLF